MDASVLRLGFALLLLPGCYAAIGPQIGLVLPEGRPTVGWELSAASFSVGQVVAAHGTRADDGSPGWTRRTYVAWEPRFGVDTNRASVFVGGGGTLGMRWDRCDDLRLASGSFLGGLWGGAVVPFDPHTDYLSGHTIPYFSIALGWRGDEIYLAPKLGVLQEPSFPSDVGGFGH
jgi:hypothetical protein